MIISKSDHIVPISPVRGDMSTMLKFQFNEEKAIEILAYIAQEVPGQTPLYVSKILFYAEKWHLNKFGRPIIGDTFYAMQRGPVPSTIKNFIDEKWDWVEKPEAFDDAVTMQRSDNGLTKLMQGKREPNLNILSASDIECVKQAIAYCLPKSASQLSHLTHFEKAWLNAETNKPMDYLYFIDEDNENREEIIEISYENAIHGI